jgi:putative membrane protein
MAQQHTTSDLVRIGLVVLAILVLGPMVTMVLATPMMGMYGGMGGHMWGGQTGNSAAPVWSIVLSLVWLVVLLGVGYLIYRWSTHRHPGAGDPALDELRLAYARGDLTDEEFEERRSRLQAEE